MTFIQSFDLSIAEAAGRLREAAGGFFTPLFKVITLSGTVGAVFIAAAIVFLVFRKTRKCGITAGIALLFGLLFTNILMKNIIARPRPYSDVSWEFYILWVKAGSLKESGFSFPSGHATAATAHIVMLACHTASHRRRGSDSRRNTSPDTATAGTMPMTTIGSNPSMPS